MPSRYFAIDASAGLIKRALGQAAVTATAYVGTQWDQKAAAITDLIAVIQIESINVAAGSIYTFRLVGSNVADRSDAQVLAVGQVGLASVVTIETRNSAAGDQLVLRGLTEKNDTMFRYIDLHVTIAGGSATITFGAYLTKEF